jgi:predicted transcriptional regulator
VAPNLSKARAQRAKELGLGERLAEARREQVKQQKGG